MPAADDQHHTSSSTSNYVYVHSKDHGWVPARVLQLLDGDQKDKLVEVEIPVWQQEQSIQSNGGKGSSKRITSSVELTHYPNKALPLQNVDEHGVLQEVPDMVDLPFLHEVRRLGFQIRVLLDLPRTNNHYYRTGVL